MFSSPQKPTRRQAIKTIGAIGALGALSSTGFAAAKTPSKLKLKKGSVIVFQGDSITDAGRDKSIAEPNDAKALGRGYAAMLAGSLLGQYADLELKVYNRGISGNKIPDLAGRWQQDVIDLKPDVLSILVGVNDLWHQFAFGNKYKATVQDYENGYRELIERAQREVPGVQIVIGEAFTTREAEEFKPLKDYAAVCKKLAAEFKLPFVPFDSIFKSAIQSAPAKFWLGDGIHPSIPGHALMANAWRAATGV
ncbi:MAG: SGNH/GDSL hydrolase family protein [Opitutales bacterium]